MWSTTRRALPPTRQQEPVEHCQAPVVHLLNRLQQQQAKIIIPTPALAEVLVKADRAAALEYLRILGSSRHFRLAPFDEKAAVEFADRQAERQSGEGRAPGETRAKAKFDDQILAIAAVEGATTIYSDDGGLAKLAGSRFDVVRVLAVLVVYCELVSVYNASEPRISRLPHIARMLLD